MSVQRITINHLSYKFETAEKALFDGLSLTFAKQRYGLVGANGSGKSTLLKLLLREITPDSGNIEINGSIAVMPQHHSDFVNQTVAEVLGVSEKIAALKRIEAGSVNETDFDIVGDDWDLQSRIDLQFTAFELQSLPLTQSFVSLSCGERTRLLLVSCLLKQPDFLIFDEPTNNLDQQSRRALYQFITTWDKGLIIASHDRQLLKLMDHIVELTSVAVYQYGGDYDFYMEQKQLADAAREQHLQSRMQNLQAAEKSVQKRLQQHLKSQSKGERAKKAQIKAKGSYDKLGVNAEKERSENTLGRIKRHSERQLSDLQQKITAVKEEIPVDKKLGFSLPDIYLPATKIILSIENLCFSYDDKILFQNFNFRLQGAERVALLGSNGAGKSTLAKLILKELQADAGEIDLAINSLAYLDQHCSALNNELTVLENYQQFNPSQTETLARINLAQFKFRNKHALVRVSQLSGGERLRALLACVLMADSPPQLLILDEPTNHLDLDSVKYLEQVLQAYQGALLVISHDADFLKAIRIDQQLLLP